MGYGMAMNVRRKMDKKSTLFINDVNRSACEKFAQEFAAEGEIVIVDTAREVAEKADVIISIVPTSQHVRAVYLDSENGVIAGKANGKRLLLECSTIDSQTTRDVGETLQKVSTDMTYIDTPVSVCYFLPFLLLKPETNEALRGWCPWGGSWDIILHDWPRRAR
jgi:3-hydroxyisobutyrate/3-hydroxypropionate dehydrogenase